MTEKKKRCTPSVLTLQWENQPISCKGPWWLHFFCDLCKSLDILEETPIIVSSKSCLKGFYIFCNYLSCMTCKFVGYILLWLLFCYLATCFVYTMQRTAVYPIVTTQFDGKPVKTTFRSFENVWHSFSVVLMPINP